MDFLRRLSKFDDTLQRGLDNGFARVFGGEVVPSEVEELLKEKAAESVMQSRTGRTLAPCTYIVSVADKDYLSLLDKRPSLVPELRGLMQRYIRNSGWDVDNEVQVHLNASTSLRSGQLLAHASFEPWDGDEDENEEDAAPAAPSGLAGFVRDQDHPSPADAAEEHPAGAHAAEDDAADAADAGVHDSGAHAAPAHAAAEQPLDAQPAPAPTGYEDVDPYASPYGQQGPAEEFHAPVSYPGTEVIAHNAATPASDNPAAVARDLDATNQTVVLILRDGSDRRYTLHDGTNMIGRGNAVDLRIPDTGVSRQHAVIAWDGHDAVLTDLQSTNGTYVNDTRIESSWLLENGDYILLGHSEIEVQFMTGFGTGSGTALR